MKKRISVFLAVIMLLSLCGCGGQTGTETTVATQTSAATESLHPVVSLHNKKVIFIGNSYTQNAFAVIHKNSYKLTQEERSNDPGFFYQLCKENGADVSVTNWCFGGHSIYHTFGHPCTKDGACKGVDHTEYLKDRYFDYVVMQCHREAGYNGDIAAQLQPVMDLFIEANPNVRFLVLVPHMAIEKKDAWAFDVLTLKGTDIKVCNWGQMVYDICEGVVDVPGATQEHSRSSYVISVSEKDGYHQNMLAGYLTALMTYCAITGESAVGQPYAFCNDPSIHPKFDIKLHRKQYYTYDGNTNYDAILQSPEDMKGLQELVDRYLEQYN